MRGYTASPEKCRHLQKDHLCSSYKNRPTICREWPFSPKDTSLFSRCSYSFTQIGEWPFNQIRNGANNQS
jgi:Fe-S-cluster containining protein